MYPYDNDELDEEERALNAQIKNIIPFAVVGSEKSIIVGGRQVRLAHRSPSMTKSIHVCRASFR